MTDTYLYDEVHFSHLGNAIQHIEDLVANQNIQLPSDSQLVLELKLLSDVEQLECRYYFVAHQTRCLFWLEEFNVNMFVDYLNGVTALSHIRM